MKNIQNNEEKRLNFSECVDLLNSLIKKNVLRLDPDNGNNLLVWREAGTQGAAGFYSENVLSVAQELLNHPDDQQYLLNALVEAERASQSNNSMDIDF